MQEPAVMKLVLLLVIISCEVSHSYGDGEGDFIIAMYENGLLLLYADRMCCWRCEAGWRKEPV